MRCERYFRRTQALRTPHHLLKAKSSNKNACSSPDQHPLMSLDTRTKIILPIWLKRHEDDPAVLVCLFIIQLILFLIDNSQDFLPRLKNYLLARLLGREYDGDELNFTVQEWNSVIIEQDTIYRHKVLRVKYTTYDLRQNQDSLNPRTRNADFMILAPNVNEDSHPYWYGRILGVYHANVHHVGQSSQSRKMEFLFVRWFGRDRTPTAGWKTKRLHRLAFVPGNSEQAFGFINPSQIIRAVHLIPAFKWGKVTELLTKSVIARGLSDPVQDWQLYYVSM